MDPFSRVRGRAHGVLYSMQTFLVRIKAPGEESEGDPFVFYKMAASCALHLPSLHFLLAWNIDCSRGIKRHEIKILHKHRKDRELIPFPFKFP